MAFAAIDYTDERTIMLGAEQTLPEKEGETLSMTECYIENITKNKDKLQAVSKIMAADSYFEGKPLRLEAKRAHCDCSMAEDRSRGVLQHRH